MRIVLLIAIILLTCNVHAQTFNMGNLGTVTNACGGIFYDSGGALGQYAPNEFYTATFCAPPGQFISFDFISFATTNAQDFLDIYDGADINAPLLGSYAGVNNPGLVTSSLGGCLTFVFSSNAAGNAAGWTANITCSTTPPSTGDDCVASLPFCTSNVYEFPNNTNAANLGAIDCLFSTPNPVWYYMQIQNPGALNINIVQTSTAGLPIDVDFDLWGPFASVPTGCSSIAEGTAPSIDCSFSAAATEQANIANAQTGEYYILLLTNFSNQAGTITFSSAAGSTSTTNCNILCGITDVTANPSACAPATNTYSVSGQISVFNPPTTGNLVIQSSCGGSVSIPAPFGNTINYTLQGLVPTGGACNINASFTADATCSFTQTYNSPASCASLVSNCPSYASISTSPATACAGQIYYVQVANTACNGTITMNVQGNYGSADAAEITWQLTSNLTGAVVASGGPGSNGGAINTTVGPLNPAVVGTIFTLTLNDSFGDGFNGTGGQIGVYQNGAVILAPISGNFGANSASIFGANITISPATITINTPTGPVVSTVTNCKNFKVPISLQNSNFCNPINVTFPWSITCGSTGATISTGSNTVTVYPSIPTNPNDVVDISFDSATCDWLVVPQNDCVQANIGSIFTITPDPNSLQGGGCSTDEQVFEVTYNGLANGPNCCSTGGPLVPVALNSTYPQGNFSVISSPFGGVNNSAYLTIPPNNIGGVANSLTLNVNVSNFCFNPPGAGNTGTGPYWVTIVIDGQIVYDQITPAVPPANYNVAINLSNIPNGYTDDSVIQIYVYPNAFAQGATNTTFNPNAVCPIPNNQDGVWNAQISASLSANFNDFVPTPAVCNFNDINLVGCCPPSVVANAQATICSGGSLSALTAWQNTVASSNPACVVYSSVTPVAGSVLPVNTVTGLNTTNGQIVQTLSAYSYCDTNDNGAIDSGDTYTIISTFTLTINPANTVSAPSGNPTVCSGVAVNPLVVFTTTGATGIGAVVGLPSGMSASWSSNTITVSGTPTAPGTYNYTIALAGGCGNASAAGTIVVLDNLDWTNLQFPGNGQICETGSFTIYGQAFNAGVGGTSAAGAMAGLEAQFGYSTSNTNPATWTNWTNAGFNAQVGNNDEYSGILSGLAPGVYYYTFRYRINNCAWQYGGFSAAGGGFWGGNNVSGILTVIDSPDAGSDGTVSACSSGTPVNLFGAFGGTPSNTGSWTGPSALDNGFQGTYNPIQDDPGSYTYTVTDPNNVCPPDNSVVSVTETSSPQASIAYASPVCANVTAVQSPTISGAQGGSFTAVPAGLGLSPAGTFNSTTAAPGTYTITYTIAEANGCSAFQTQATVVVQIAPAPPALSPQDPCAANDSVFTATGGAWYEFLVNGVSTGPASAVNVLDTSALAAGTQVCVRSFAAPPIMDGNLTDPAWTPFIPGTTGGPTSQAPFTVADTRLDGLRMLNRNGLLYFAVAGNEIDGTLLVENNRIILFIDCRAGGFNSLSAWVNRSNAGPPAFTFGLRNLDGGIQFDPGFEADYILSINRANLVGSTTFYDLYDMVSNTNVFLGSSPTTQFGYLESFTDNDLTRGFEFYIPLASIGSPVSLKVFGMLINDPGEFAATLVSNQFLSVAGNGDGNYGSGSIFFNAAAPNPVLFVTAEDCYEEVCVTMVGPETPLFDPVPPVCANDPLPQLPSTSNNGISGSWSGPVNNQYTFTPGPGECAEGATLSLIINPTPTTGGISHD